MFQRSGVVHPRASAIVLNSGTVIAEDVAIDLRKFGGLCVQESRFDSNLLCQSLHMANSARLAGEAVSM